MNVKKSKHKRTKNVNVSAPQNVLNEISDVSQETKCEEQVINEVKEVCVESITSSNEPIEDVLVGQQDAPVKPKRKKGKKKKQEEITDDGNVVILAVDEKQESKLNVTGQPLETQSDGENDNKPTIRKNKKSKKIAEKAKVEETIDNIQQTIQREYTATGTAQDMSISQPETAAKKKHKKKKQPNNDTKSEDVTCVSAFQKLLEPDRSQEEIALSDSSCAEALIQKNTDSQHMVPLVSTAKSKNKKKNKKDKKDPLTDPIDDIQSEDAFTSPFKKLLEPERSQEEKASGDDLLQENKDLENVPELVSTSKSKSKKKNKKAKMNTHVDLIDNTQENRDSVQALESLSSSESKIMITKDIKDLVVGNVSEKEKEEEENINSERNIKDEMLELLECKNDENTETSPKPKAKIAKPVDKKGKDKKVRDIKNKEIEIESNFVPSITDNKSSEIIVEENVLTKVENKIEELKTESSIIIMEPLTDNKVSLKANREQDNDSILCIQKGQEDNVSENTKFTEVRPSRKKKRSGKSKDVGNVDQEGNIGIRTNETEVSLDTPTTLIDRSESKDLEVTNITPDFIYYPRSSSQQQLDNNNNMMIREISSPDDVRLAIPILISTPIVEGSGESPEVRSKVIPLNLEVTEINEESPNTSEKEDMKPKPSEGILDLKASIEKSLAELTTIEKKEIEAEKEFEEVLAYNLKNPLDDVSKPQHEKTIEEENPESCSAPVCPMRKDKKGKSKKKLKKAPEQTATVSSATNNSSNINVSETKSQESSKTKDKEQKSETQHTKNKQQSLSKDSASTCPQESIGLETPFEPIKNFEDVLTSSNEDINKTFELIAKEVIISEGVKRPTSLQRPEISITEPEEDTNKEENAKENPVSQPKNLLGTFNIPVQSNKTDYKKEKNKPPSTMKAKVKIKDATDIEKCKRSKESQTSKNKLIKQYSKESFSYKTNENDDFVYKYSFRKVFLPNVCHVCKKELGQRVICKFCNLVFYCSVKHKDEDWSQHQFLCFAVCTIAHLKEQKFIYGDVKNKTGQDYRILRMQTIMSCEKMLKRKLVPWEQEALLYPRICSDPSCREWKQTLLTDCEGCGQVAFCNQYPEHLPISHQRWCKSYALYQKLVSYQQSHGRLEPRLPSKILRDTCQIPEKINEVLATLYEEKIDMTDIQYAALTQIATAPLTAAYSYQITKKNTNGLTKKSTFSIHIVGAELQYEADVLNKWEIFFLHLRPDVQDLRVILINPDLNPSNLPLDLLSKVKLCDVCHSSNRRLLFQFEDKKTYQDYCSSEQFILPDIVCAFNSSIERASIYNNTDHWPSTIACVSKLKAPLLLTAYTINELIRDLSRVKLLSDFNVISEPKYNSFASVRPDRNFITDDEMPLLFKNYCFSVVCGA